MMMKITYNSIRNLKSRYAKKMNSNDEHLEVCTEYSSDLNQMIAFTEFPVNSDVSPLLNIKKAWREKKPQLLIFSMMIALVFGILVFEFLTAPEYIPYDKEIVTINEIRNGSVQVQFGEKVSGYDLNRYPSEDHSSYVYHLTTWDSIWSRSIAKTRVDNVVLNPTGEAIAAVYYYETNGSEDRLIYGKSLNPSGGVETLPRLFLGYYALIALGLVLICAFLIILFRRHKKVTDLTIKILFLPVSYLIGQFMLKGMKSSSYSALRDFYAILLIMIPLYIAFLMTLYLIKTYRTKTIK